MAKIAIVSGHFMPEIGYQEVYLARAFSRLGHEVEVFTSTAISVSARKLLKPYEEGRSQCGKYGYHINRVRPILALNSNVWANGIRRHVESFGPDFAVMVGLAKMFGLDLFDMAIANSRTKFAGMFGDSAEYHPRKTTIQKAKALLRDVIFHLYKKRVYRNAVNCLSRIVLNTPETETFFRRVITSRQREKFEKKKLILRLGFDPDEFQFDANQRALLRRQLRIDDDSVVAITATRVLPSKNLERIIDSVSELHRKDIAIDYIIVGFLDDDYGGRLKQYIAGQPCPDRFHCFGFKTHEEVMQLYSAADLGIWLKAAISIQEAMGTGLSILLERKPIVEHLIREGQNGWYYDRPELFQQGLELAVQSLHARSAANQLSTRQSIAKFNASYLSYDVIAQEILDALRDRPE